MKIGEIWEEKTKPFSTVEIIGMHTDADDIKDIENFLSDIYKDFDDLQESLVMRGDLIVTCRCIKCNCEGGGHEFLYPREIFVDIYKKIK